MDEKRMNDICAVVDANKPELKALSKKIFDNPELGTHEVKACQWQKELLEKHGFEVETGYCDLPTAYKAVYKGKKPGVKIAMLAEYDALPGIGHACGHSLICMTSIGAAFAIQPLVDEFGGEIHVVGTPAEETQGAKVEMARHGAFKEYDVAMMAHPAPKNESSTNNAGIRSRKVEFFGKTAHAAGKPWEGVNALDAVIAFFTMVNALRQQTKDDARIHGVIRDGGEAPNIIPEHAEVDYYVRSKKMEDVDDLMRKVENIIKGAALGTGCTYKITRIEEDFMDSCSNVALSDLACNMYKKLGHDIDLTIGFSAGSSDVGDVSHQCPAIQLMSGIGAYDDGKYYSAHTREFASIVGREASMDKCLEFSKAFALTAYELMTNPDKLKEIKDEFLKEAYMEDPYANEI